MQGPRTGNPPAPPATDRRPLATRPDPARLAAALAADHEGDLLRRENSSNLTAAPGPLHALPRMTPHAGADWVYIDTETTGLSGGVGNLAFMIGVARTDAADRLVLRQWLIAGFSAEPRMLESLCDWIGDHSVLVSYNGKGFDLPLLQARLRLHGIDHPLATLPHLDLVHLVRNAYRRSWPDCRLQTAERRLLDLRREGDLPGAFAPQAWLDWVRHGGTNGLQGVLRHNAQDVVSLACLHRRLVAVYRGGNLPGVDHAALGRAWRRAGDETRARSVWEAAGPQLGIAGQLELAASYRRCGMWHLAESCWLRAFARGSRLAACELSKYHEHRRRDLRRALRFASYCSEVDVQRRLGRIAGKLAEAPQLELFSEGSIGECDHVPRAI